MWVLVRDSHRFTSFCVGRAVFASVGKGLCAGYFELVFLFLSQIRCHVATAAGNTLKPQPGKRAPDKELTASSTNAYYMQRKKLVSEFAEINCVKCRPLAQSALIKAEKKNRAAGKDPAFYASPGSGSGECNRRSPERALLHTPIEFWKNKKTGRSGTALRVFPLYFAPGKRKPIADIARNPHRKSMSACDTKAFKFVLPICFKIKML